jgi:hypothetical protein
MIVEKRGGLDSPMSTNSALNTDKNLDQSDATVFIFNQCLAATKHLLHRMAQVQLLGK